MEVVDWGWVQWCYDEVVCGARGWRAWVLLLVAVGVRGWEWVVFLGLGRRRVGRGRVVNAAWEGNEGEGVVVVEI